MQETLSGSIQHQLQALFERSILRVYLLTLQKICWQGTLGRSILCFVLVVLLLMHGNSLLHGCLLSVPLLAEQLALESQCLLSHSRSLVHQSAQHSQYRYRQRCTEDMIKQQLYIQTRKVTAMSLHSLGCPHLASRFLFFS